MVFFLLTLFTISFENCCCYFKSDAIRAKKRAQKVSKEFPDAFLDEFSAFIRQNISIHF
jgi:hypothetical protein